MTPNAAKLDSQTATTKASTAATKQQQQKSTSETITTTTKQTTQQEQPKKIEEEQAKPTTVKQTDEKVSSSPSATLQDMKSTTTTTAAARAASTVIPKIRVKIPTNPPNNSYEFEKAFNELDRQDFYEYLKIIPPVSFGRIFKESLTEKILNSIVEGLTRVFTVDEGDEGRTELAERALQIMGHLTRVGRFDMIVMFLSDEEKRGTEQLFDLLAQKLKHDEKLMVELKRVRSKYA